MHAVPARVLMMHAEYDMAPRVQAVTNKVKSWHCDGWPDGATYGWFSRAMSCDKLKRQTTCITDASLQ
jgi:hypothetical protein